MTEQQFDIFLCHNSEDKSAVIEIAQKLQRHGLRPWLDVWELQPGTIWQYALEQKIESINAAAVFVGEKGLGPWQSEEIYAFLQEFIHRQCPVIPVLLPNAPKQPTLPIFLRNRHWVDFRIQEPDPLMQLIWGITGQKDQKNELAPRLISADPPASFFPPDPSPAIVNSDLVLTVSLLGNAQYLTISEAIEQAQPNTQIRVLPGTYYENLVINKPLQVFGEGQASDIVIESLDVPCLIMQTESALVAGLSFCRQGEVGNDHGATVDIPQGQLILENCNVTSKAGVGISIHSSMANPIIRHCQIMNAKSCGVLVWDSGQGSLESCEISGNTSAGLEIMQGGCPNIQQCKIYDGKKVGIYVRDEGLGMIEDCDIFGNAYSGIEITQSGNPHVLRCRIYDGKNNGILIHDGGQGTIEECDISGNLSPGIYIAGQGSNPTIRKSKIFKGNKEGICVVSNGQGSIEGCEIYENNFSGMMISNGGNPNIHRCRVHNNKHYGILIHDQGKGTIKECAIYDNSLNPQFQRLNWNHQYTLKPLERKGWLTNVRVPTVVFSPTEEILASVCNSNNNDRFITLWKGEIRSEIYGFEYGISDIAFSPDGQILASGGNGNTTLWQVATRKKLYTFQEKSYVYCVAFSPNGQILASGSMNKTVKLWEVPTKRELRTLTGHTNSVESVAFSPNGQILASGSRDRTIKLWEVSTGHEIYTLTGQTEWVMSVAFSPDGQILASGSHDGTIKLWEVSTGHEICTLGEPNNIYKIHSVSFSPDGQILASGTFRCIKLWLVNTRQVISTLEGQNQSINSVAFSPDGRELASGSDDNTVMVWKMV